LNVRRALLACFEAQLISRIHELVRGNPRFGDDGITVLLTRDRFKADFDRVYQLWHREGLKVPYEKVAEKATAAFIIWSSGRIMSGPGTSTSIGREVGRVEVVERR